MKSLILAATISAGLCGEYVKFTVVVVREEQVPGTEAGSLQTDTVTFWEGPIVPRDGTTVIALARARTQSIANLGAWGTDTIDGYPNSAYLREYFPARVVVRARHEFGCRR